MLTLKLLSKLTPNIIDEVYRFILSLYDKRGFFYYDRSSVAKVLVYLGDTWDAIETLNVIGRLSDLNSSVKNSIINWVLSMYDNETGDFMGTYDPTHNKIEHSPFSLSFLSGVRILQLLGALNKIDKNKIIRRIYRRFYHDGHFGDIFDNVVENYYVIYCLKILGGLNESVAYKDSLWLKNMINPVTGLESSGNLAITGGIVISLGLLGHLNLLPVNKTVESILSLQGHLYGGFLNLPKKSDGLDNYLDMWDTHDVIQSLFLLNASSRLEEPFYVEKIPDFSDEPGYNYTNEDGNDEDGFFPPISSGGYSEVGSNSILWGFVVLTIIMGIGFLVVAPILYIANKKLSNHGGKRKSKRKRRKTYIRYR